MNREEVMNIVIKNIKSNIDGLDKVTINPEKSMMHYGADSLDMVEVVSSSMHELQIKVPRTEFANLENINELVNLLTEFSSQNRVNEPSLNKYNSALVDASEGIQQEDQMTNGQVEEMLSSILHKENGHS